ncbi:MAG TPA: hypothetical protein VGB45_15825 [Abditibacterium sp.]|jgi:hypothetical protein
MDANASRNQTSARSNDELLRESATDWSGGGDFLTPQQRLQAVGEILATIALRSLQQEGLTFEEPVFEKVRRRDEEYEGKKHESEKDRENENR